jgi:hypothetical protein
MFIGKFGSERAEESWLITGSIEFAEGINVGAYKFRETSG